MQACKSGCLAPGCVQIPPTDVCAGKRPQITQSRAHHHARTTTRTRTDKPTNQPTRNVTLKGKERSEEGNPERSSEMEGKHPLVLHQLEAFCPPKPRHELLFFLLPLLLLKSFSMVPRVVCGFSS